MPDLTAPKFAAGNDALQIDLLSDFNNPDGDSYAASVDWGDGGSSFATIDRFDSLSVISAEHTYPAAGDYPLTLTLISRATSERNSASIEVTVADAPPPPISIPQVVGPDAFRSPSGPSSPNLLDASGPPQVIGVYVDSSTWTSAFRTYMAMDDLGYAIPAGADQLKTLAWNNVNEVRIAFNEDVTIAQDDLILTGVKNDTYAFASFNYDASTFVAT
jgi:hypothetical protein